MCIRDRRSITATVTHSDSGVKTVTAGASAAEPDIDESNNSGADTVLVGPGADLELQAFAVEPVQMVGGVQQYMISVSNAGPDTASAQSVRVAVSFDPMPIDLSADQGSWNCTDNDFDSCFLSSELGPGQGSGDLNLSGVYVTPGQKTLTVTLLPIDDLPDPDPTNNEVVVDLFLPFPDNMFANGFELPIN